MISEVVMPQMGADMTEGVLLRWLKHEGDAVWRGEIIAEIETDKANVEIEAFESGVFRKVIAKEGDTVQVGEVIAVIAGPEDDISPYQNGAAAKQAAPPGPAGAAPAPAAKATATTVRAATPEPDYARPAEVAASKDASPLVEATPTGGGPPTPSTTVAVKPPGPTAPHAPATPGRRRVSPLARRIAQERGIDLAQVSGSGPDGRIISKDVESLGQAHASGPAQPAQADIVLAPSRMRQAIARRMAQSKRDAPHYYLLLDIDMTDAVALRKQINEELPEDERASINDLIVRACALALQRHPQFNVTLSGGQATQHGAQHICIGIAMDDGLIAPALLDAGAKPLRQIAREAKDLIARAHGGSLRASEMSEGTFTVSNLGAFGVETLVAIIQPPQTAILGVGAAVPAAVVRDGAVVVREMMKVALSADHRVTDGAQGAQLLGEIKRLLERPALLLL